VGFLFLIIDVVLFLYFLFNINFQILNIPKF